MWGLSEYSGSRKVAAYTPSLRATGPYPFFPGLKYPKLLGKLQHSRTFDGTKAGEEMLDVTGFCLDLQGVYASWCWDGRSAWWDQKSWFKRNSMFVGNLLPLPFLWPASNNLDGKGVAKQHHYPHIPFKCCMRALPSPRHTSMWETKIWS